MMRTSVTRGFSLIELLVVLSIMSLLFSVVLSALTKARINAANNALTTEISAIRAEAGIIYLNNGNFDSLCSSGSKSNTLFVAATKNSAQNIQGMTGLCLSSGTGGVIFNNGAITNYASGLIPTTNPGKWALSLLRQDGQYFCADYTGYTGVQASRGIDNSSGGVADLKCN